MASFRLKTCPKKILKLAHCAPIAFGAAFRVAFQAEFCYISLVDTAVHYLAPLSWFLNGQASACTVNVKTEEEMAEDRGSDPPAAICVTVHFNTLGLT